MYLELFPHNFINDFPYIYSFEDIVYQYPEWFYINLISLC